MSWSLARALVVAAIIAITGCSGAAPTPTAPESSDARPTEAPAASASTSTGAPPSPPAESAEPAGSPFTVGPLVLTDEVFTAPADPIMLTVSGDDERAVTSVVGPEGGTLSASAADGTAFELEIAPESLPIPVTITMTPISAIEGLPDEVTPERHMGVDLAPDGLPLSRPAVLRIIPGAPVDAGSTVGLAYGRSGAAGLSHLVVEDGAITMEINHFSGYTAVAPLAIASVRPSVLFRFFNQAEIEARLRSEVAALVAMERQRQLLGMETLSTLDIARGVMPTFRRLVLSPRVAAADQSCGHAHDAMEAYLEYQRQLQILGVAGDPEFDLVNAGIVPADLVELAVELCFREAYERCKRIGEWPATALYYFSVLSRNEDMLGVLPSPRSVSLAQDYLHRCGRWRVHVATTYRQDDESFTYQIEASRDFHVQWEPGNGQYGIIGGEISGSGPLEVTLLTSGRPSGDDLISSITTDRDSHAIISHMAWDHYEGPTLTGEPIPPQPSELTLKVDYGLVGYTRTSQGSGEPIDDYEDFAITYRVTFLEQQGRDWTPEEAVTILSNSGGEATFETNWAFRTEPFKATTAFSGTYFEPTPIDVRVEVNVEHEPL